MRAHVLLVLAGALLLGSASKLKKLSDVERDHFQALQVWMSEDQTKAFFKLKTEEERNQYLKDQGLWARFYDYPEDLREKILLGEVSVGWTQDMVFMAFGKPFKRKRLTGRPAARSELFIYRMEVAEDGAVMPWIEGSKTTYKAVDTYEIHIYVDDERVTEIKQLDEWTRE